MQVKCADHSEKILHPVASCDSFPEESCLKLSLQQPCQSVSSTDHLGSFVQLRSFKVQCCEKCAVKEVVNF